MEEERLGGKGNERLDEGILTMFLFAAGFSFAISTKVVMATENIYYPNDYYSCTIRVDTGGAELEMYNIEHGKSDTLTIDIYSDCSIKESFKSGALIPTGPTLVVKLQSPQGKL